MMKFCTSSGVSYCMWDYISMGATHIGRTSGEPKPLKKSWPGLGTPKGFWPMPILGFKTPGTHEADMAHTTPTCKN